MKHQSAEHWTWCFWHVHYLISMMCLKASLCLLYLTFQVLFYWPHIFCLTRTSPFLNTTWMIFPWKISLLHFQYVNWMMTDYLMLAVVTQPWRISVIWCSKVHTSVTAPSCHFLEDSDLFTLSWDFVQQGAAPNTIYWLEFSK